MPKHMYNVAYTHLQSGNCFALQNELAILRFTNRAECIGTIEFNICLHIVLMMD